ncbi:MAG: hypothetical protein KJO98_02750 [Rhodothermia bacterium]|nr:hypothetical protein [Rhodothermia bacterium]
MIAESDLAYRTDRCPGFALVATLVVVFGLGMPVKAHAQNDTFQFHGYFKNLGIVSSSAFSDETRFLDISRLRTKGIAAFGSNIRSEVWLDTEALMGSFIGTVDFDIGRELDRREWLDLDWQLATANRFRMEQRIFRAFVSVYAGPITATLGRQRVAWGTGFAWNPTDLLNPYNPAAIELGEKAGIDGLHIAAATGDFSRLEAAYAAGDDIRESSLAVRGSSNVGEYDVSLMGGYFRDDWVLGGDFAGYLGDAGLRGEAAYTAARDRADYIRFTLTADRSFEGDYYGFVEYYYNGQGTTDKSKYDFREVLDGRSFNVARNYIAVSVMKAVTPLVAASFYTLANLDDCSALVGPSLTYSLGDNAEAGGAVYFFAGKSDSEFGAQSHAYFAYLQFFF